MEDVVKKRRPGLMIVLFGLVVAAAGLGMVAIYNSGMSEPGRSQLGSDLAVAEPTATSEPTTTSEPTATTARASTTAPDTESGSSSTGGTTNVATESTEADDPTSDDPGSTTTVEGDVRSYTMAGGEVVLTFLEDEVRLVSVTLNDGFTIETNEVGKELHIDLRDGVKHSAVVAWVDDGPQILLDDH